MPQPDWEQIANYVEGSTITPAGIADRYQVDEDEVETCLGEQHVETCVGCGWWFRERIGAVGDPVCDDCRATSEAERPHPEEAADDEFLRESGE